MPALLRPSPANPGQAGLSRPTRSSRLLEVEHSAGSLQIEQFHVAAGDLPLETIESYDRSAKVGTQDANALAQIGAAELVDILLRHLPGLRQPGDHRVALFLGETGIDDQQNRLSRDRRRNADAVGFAQRGLRIPGRP